LAPFSFVVMGLLGRMREDAFPFVAVAEKIIGSDAPQVKRILSLDRYSPKNRRL